MAAQSSGTADRFGGVGQDEFAWCQTVGLPVETSFNAFRARQLLNFDGVAQSQINT